LSAIATFSAIGDVSFHEVLPRLRKIYLNVPSTTLSLTNVNTETISRKFSDNVRVKIGEVFQSIIMRLGELLPQNAESLFAIFFSAIKSHNSLQPSSLTNIGLMSRMLLEQNAFFKYAEEVVLCTMQILNSQSCDSNVYSAALLLMGDLLSSIGKNVLTIIPHHLKNIYTLLRFIASRKPEKEDELLVQVHANNTLIAFENMMAELMRTEDNSGIPEVLKIVSH